MVEEEAQHKKHMGLLLLLLLLIAMNEGTAMVVALAQFGIIIPHFTTSLAFNFK